MTITSLTTEGHWFEVKSRAANVQQSQGLLCPFVSAKVDCIRRAEENLWVATHCWRDALRAMPDIRHDIQEVISLGSTIAARAIVTGTLQDDFAGISANGRSFRIDQGLFAHVREDKIVEAWEIVDTASLLQQLGAVLEVSPDR